MILIYSPFPNREEARTASLTLLQEGLIACANLLPQGLSLYVWEGKIQEEDETYVLFKTTVELAEKAKKRLEEIHPYEVPAVIAWDTTANRAFENWVTTVTKASESLLKR